MTCIALLEDVPQLIIQIIFLSTVEPGLTAGLSIGLTVMSICWRVAKRSLRLLGTAAMESYPDLDGAVITPTSPGTNTTIGSEVKTETPASENVVV